jgi:hypothetical protein
MVEYLLFGTACMLWGLIADAFLALIFGRRDDRRWIAALEPPHPRAMPVGSAPVPGNAEATYGQYSRPLGGQICGLFAVDIADFTNPCRDEHIQLYLRERLYDMLERAFDGSGVPWQACYQEDRGDGALVVVPPGANLDALADPLPERLFRLVRVHNRLSSNEAHIQLRAAAHIGMVYRDAHGLAGDATTHLCRLLDTSRFKHLVAASGSDLAFIASDYVYDMLIRRRPALIDPAAFEPVTMDLKWARETGWVQLLGVHIATAGDTPKPGDKIRAACDSRDS